MPDSVASNTLVNTSSRNSLAKYSSKIHRSESFKHRRDSAPLLVNPYGDGAGLNFDDEPEDEEEERELLKQSQQDYSWKYLIVTCSACLAWMVASGGNVSLINWLLKKEGFHYPITVTWLGQMASWLVSIIAYVTRHYWTDHTVWYTCTWSEYFKTFIPLGFLTAASFSLCGMAYMYLSVAFVQMLKASSPITTMIIMFLLGLEQPRLDIILAISVIALGCLLSAVGEVECSAIGIALYLLSDVFDALRMVWTESMLRTRMNVWEAFYMIGPSSSIFLFLFACWSEVPQWLNNGDFAYHFANAHELFFAASFATSLVNILTMVVVKRTNSLSFKVLGQIKNIGVILMGVVLFGNTVAPMQALSYTVSTCGFLMYHRAKENQRREEEEDALLAAAEVALAAEPEFEKEIHKEVVRKISHIRHNKPRQSASKQPERQPLLESEHDTYNSA